MTKFLLSILIFFLLIVPNVYAFQGDCSSHGGIDCDAGADWDGSVRCIDGWRDSIDRFEDAEMCYPKMKEPNTGAYGYRNIGEKAKFEAEVYTKDIVSFALDPAVYINKPDDEVSDYLDSLIKDLNKYNDAAINYLYTTQVVYLTNDPMENSFIDVFFRSYSKDIQKKTDRAKDFIEALRKSQLTDQTEVQKGDSTAPIGQPLLTSMQYQFKDLNFYQIGEMKILAKEAKNQIMLLMWQPAEKKGVRPLKNCSVGLSDVRGLNQPVLLQKKKFILFKADTQVIYSIGIRCFDENNRSFESNFVVRI